MRKHLPLLIAIAGLVLTGVHLLDLAQVLGVLMSAAVMAVQGGGELDPAAMGGVVGAAAAAIATRGLYTLLPAAFLYIAWVPLRYRPGWFHKAVLVAGFYFIQLFPAGTVIGGLLLIAVRRNKASLPEKRA